MDQAEDWSLMLELMSLDFEEFEGFDGLEGEDVITVEEPELVCGSLWTQPLKKVDVEIDSDLWHNCDDYWGWMAAVREGETVDTKEDFLKAMRSIYCNDVRSGLVE